MKHGLGGSAADLFNFLLTFLNGLFSIKKGACLISNFRMKSKLNSFVQIKHSSTCCPLYVCALIPADIELPKNSSFFLHYRESCGLFSFMVGKRSFLWLDSQLLTPPLCSSLSGWPSHVTVWPSEALQWCTAGVQEQKTAPCWSTTWSVRLWKYQIWWPGKFCLCINQNQSRMWLSRLSFSFSQSFSSFPNILVFSFLPSLRPL